MLPSSRASAVGREPWCPDPWIRVMGALPLEWSALCPTFPSIQLPEEHSMYSRCFVKSGAAVKYISLALLYLSSCTLLYLPGKGVEVTPSAAAAEPPATPAAESAQQPAVPKYVVVTALT